MNYIINPVWFYLASVFTSVRVVAVIGVIVCSVMTVAFVASIIFDDPNEDELKTLKKAMKTSLTLCIIFAVLLIFVPVQNAIYRMMVAKCATYENAENAVEAVKRAADYLIEVIKSIK